MNTPALLLCDFYKTVHSEQYPEGITKLVSYFTPRMTRIEQEDKLIMFGLQAFIKQYLIEYFNDYFFGKTREKVLEEYNRILSYTLGKGSYNDAKVGELYDLGYLPLEIKAIAEGTRVPIKVPMLEISNTHPNFAWLVNSIETIMSCSLWHPMISANVGYKYRMLVNQYFDMSVEEDVPRARALGDFSMRGQESLESATKSSAAFCLSFLNTATVPAIPFLEHYYNCDCTKEPVAYGSISTEHSVMCSNTAVDKDEVTMLRRLLTKVYPNHSFSMVSDSYDYWNLVDNLLVECKHEILNHNGTLLIRGDSGDPIQVVTDTVFHLWDIFGGSVNSKGYKVLDSHVKAIYGDSITPQRAESIYKRLVEKGFACNNVVLGVGSFSMQCLEEEGVYKPFTRDTFGIAVKATYGEIGETPIMIFKDPKTDTGNFKKSQSGMCRVYKNAAGIMIYEDGYDKNTFPQEQKNLLACVFRDGKMVKEYSLSEIRNLLHGGKF
ncbi:MAG: nicotinate phosphoribosyltransferase [Clostridiales bacterium]|jgi:nicotinamide phosphoribosyltransferase|nr:nicotinate phosphoribosyltransferase [Clostridiales bacterium]